MKMKGMNSEHLWLAIFFTALFLLPGMAILAGTRIPPYGENLARLFYMIQVLALGLIPVGGLLMLCMFAKRLLQASFKKPGIFDFFAFLVILVTLGLAYVDLFMIPPWRKQLAPIVEDLPPSTQFMLEYNALLLLPVLLLPFLIYRFRQHPRRERYFAVILAGEFFVLEMCAVILYFPAFKAAEAVL